MKNILRNIIVGVVGAVVFTSCDMDLRPTTAIVYDENEPIFVLASDVESFQNGILASYRALYGGTFTQSPEVMCDAFNATTGFGNNYGSIHRTDASFTTSDNYAESMWGNHYAAIKNYNIVIVGAQQQIPEELQANVDILKGTAYFCRANSYLTLARYFGKAYDPATAYTDLCVPLVLRFDLEAKPERATVQDVYDQILSDLLEAEYFFEMYGYQATMPGVYLPTIDAVRALMARYYIDVKDYDNAAIYARKVIESPVGYKLSSTVQEMEAEFLNDSGTEAIIQLYADLSEGKVYDQIYTMVTNDSDGKKFTSYFLPSQKILDAYEPDDLRLKTWFTNGKYPVFMNGTTHYGITVFQKYIGNPLINLGVVESGAHCAKPLMISEMYLIAAEAYAMNGEGDKAREYLNKLQKARGAKETEGTMDNIKTEWFRETVGEGHRFFCLKRWGDGFNGRPVQAGAEFITMSEPASAYGGKVISKDSHLFTWPVPAYEMKLNPNLVQNPGYDGN